MAEEKQTAIIIGGTSGLGRQIAIQCLARGIQPFILGPNVERIPQDQALDGAEGFYLNFQFLGSWAHNYYEFRKRLTPKQVSHIFWVSGIPQSSPFLQLENQELEELTAIHLNGPLQVLRDIFRELVSVGRPIHFVAISSTSAFKRRDGEEVYCAVQSAKAMFAAQMAGTLEKELPGSQVSLVMPGGMNTPFWRGSGKETAKFMDPAVAASFVVGLTLDNQKVYRDLGNFQSYTIERLSNGTAQLDIREPNAQQLF